MSMHVNFISSKNTGETRTIYVWGDNISIMWGSDTDDFIIELFRSFLHNYQEELKKIKGSDFNFESVELMDCKLHNVWLKRGVSYIESPKWILYKSATINPKDEKDNNFFQYSSTLALNHNEIKKRVRKHI